MIIDWIKFWILRPRNFWILLFKLFSELAFFFRIMIKSVPMHFKRAKFSSPAYKRFAKDLDSLIHRKPNQTWKWLTRAVSQPCSPKVNHSEPHVVRWQEYKSKFLHGSIADSVNLARSGIMDRLRDSLRVDKFDGREGEDSLRWRLRTHSEIEGKWLAGVVLRLEVETHKRIVETNTIFSKDELASDLIVKSFWDISLKTVQSA